MTQKTEVSSGKMWLYTALAAVVLALLMVIAMSVVFNGNGNRAVESCEKSSGTANVEKSNVLFITTSYKVTCEK